MDENQGHSAPLSGTEHSATPPGAEAAAGIPTQFSAHNIFIGKDGLRPGWRLFVFLLIFGTLALVLGFCIRHVLPTSMRKSKSIWLPMFGEAAVLLAAAIPTLLMARIEKRPAADYGLPSRMAFGKSFWAGVVWGIVALSALLFAIDGLGDFILGGLVLHGARLVKFAFFWGVFFLIVGFFEEILFRGYALFTLTKGIGFWPAALMLSGFFGAIHLFNPGETLIGGLAAGLIGLFFCLTIRRTGTLWFAIGMHASWDWAESYLYSVPDSGTPTPGHLLNSSFHGSRWITGGSVGPEGSVLVLLLVVLLWIIFDRIYPKAKYPAESIGDNGALVT